jgi:hypothetical protein
MIGIVQNIILVSPIILISYLFLGMSGLLYPVNYILVPLGYRYHSCPFCPDFGFESIDDSEEDVNMKGDDIAVIRLEFEENQGDKE